MWLRIPRPTMHGWGLLLPVVGLCLMGILTLQAIGEDAVRQVQLICFALVGLLAALGVGYHRIGRFSYALFVFGLILLACLVLDRWVDLPFVPVRRFTRRWICIPGLPELQPSEMMKLAYVLSLAWYLRYRRNYRTLGGLIAPFAISLVPMGLILMQPDLGTVVLFSPVLFAMLFVAGAKLKHLAVIILLGILAMPLFWLNIKDYQRVRITSVFLQNDALREHLEKHPERWDWFRPRHTEPSLWRQGLVKWETGAGYQLVHSKMAIGSGGLWGNGWGKGVYVQYNRLPERHNDFIFAMIAHQWGLVGSLLLIFCYVVIAVLGFDVATVTNDPFGRLLAVGLSTLLVVQTLTHLCMTVGFGPITGVTLPFVSAGGSSLISSFLCIGLLISIAHRRPVLIAKKPFVYDEESGRFQDVQR